MNQKINNKRRLYSPRAQMLLLVVMIIFGIVSLSVLIFNHSSTIKTISMYIFIVDIIYIIVLYKNTINKYEIGIFCFLFVQLISCVPGIDNMDSLVTTSYLLSFRYGISSRSFIATVVDILTSGYISMYFVWNFIFCSLLFLSFLIAVYMGNVIQKSKETVKTVVLCLSLLYLSCFTSPSAYFLPGNFGRVEIFAFILMFFLISIINKSVICWLIPLLALFVLSTHLILAFFYIPCIFIGSSG